ncbi:hypothetical protein HYH03_010241 [Edaphochlamys debaryana]|uniref:Uncharacterized protein n=1 Tax=Edaphochlamys debaryana TaxID=47281 RepID=A0A836BWG2_9CHLO|nr:hypothetical protein HYH03_010241 [Edaphochlamys debaryana]|eukprot:KAG2491455.1 hypothetical protein HYH03_010241 [Edaphochlamys debaryana]
MGAACRVQRMRMALSMAMAALLLGTLQGAEAFGTRKGTTGAECAEPCTIKSIQDYDSLGRLLDELTELPYQSVSYGLPIGHAGLCGDYVSGTGPSATSGQDTDAALSDHLLAAMQAPDRSFLPAGTPAADAATGAHNLAEKLPAGSLVPADLQSWEAAVLRASGGTPMTDAQLYLFKELYGTSPEAFLWLNRLVMGTLRLVAWRYDTMAGTRLEPQVRAWAAAWAGAAAIAEAILSDDFDFPDEPNGDVPKTLVAAVCRAANSPDADIAEHALARQEGSSSSAGIKAESRNSAPAAAVAADGRESGEQQREPTGKRPQLRGSASGAHVNVVGWLAGAPKATACRLGDNGE